MVIGGGDGSRWRASICRGGDANVPAPMVKRTPRSRPGRGRHMMARVARPRVAEERPRATSGRGGGRPPIGPEPRRAGGTGTRADTVRRASPSVPARGTRNRDARQPESCNSRIGDWSEEQTNGERCDASTAAYDAGGGYARSAKREPIAVVTPATSFVLFTSSLRRLRAQGPAGTGGTLLLQGRGAVDVRGDRNAGEGGGD